MVFITGSVLRMNQKISVKTMIRFKKRIRTRQPRGLHYPESYYILWLPYILNAIDEEPFPESSAFCCL